MLRTLLIGLDGSTTARATVELGLAWARRFDCLLIGMGVINEPAIRGATAHPREGGYLAHLQQQWITEARKHLDQQLEKFALDCATANVACKLLEDEGLPWQEVLRESERYDLVLLSQDSHFEGEVAQRTLHEFLWACPRPLVVVPAKESLPTSGEVIVAYDGSIQAARSLQAFAATGLAQLGPVRVVSVHSQSQVEAARIADRAVQYLSSHQIACKAEPICSAASPCEVLLDCIGQPQAQLLVMGACGKSRFVEFFVGSVTKSLMKSCEIPLFVFH